MKSQVEKQRAADTGASVHAPLCEACGRATEEINAAVSARHFFLSVVEMFDNGQIKAFTLTPQDGKKLKLLLEAGAKHGEFLPRKNAKDT